MKIKKEGLLEGSLLAACLIYFGFFILLCSIDLERYHQVYWLFMAITGLVACCNLVFAWLFTQEHKRISGKYPTIHLARTGITVLLLALTAWCFDASGGLAPYSEPQACFKRCL
jgi:hypothetical protein